MCYFKNNYYFILVFYLRKNLIKNIKFRNF